MQALNDPVAPSISPVTSPVKAPSKVAAHTVPLNSAATPDTLVVKEPVAATRLVALIHALKEPVAPSISPVTSPVKAPSKVAAHTVPLNSAATPETLVVNDP